MRIDAYSQIQQIYNVPKTAGVNKAAGKGGNFRDRFEISEAGKDMQTVKQAVANAPDVRADKVAAIKDAIANGTYYVSGDDFADKILEKLGSTFA